MKKKIISILLAVCFITVPIVANAEFDYSVLDEMAEEELKALKDEVAKRLGAEEPTEDSTEKVGFGTVIKEDGVAEIVIKSTSYKTEVYPSDTSGYYTYYEIKNPNNIYLACNYDLTNLSSEAKGNIENIISFQATFEGGYNYSGWSVVEDEPTKLNAYPNLLPLTKYNSWCLIEVPNTLQDVSYTLNCTINGKKYEITEDETTEGEITE